MEEGRVVRSVGGFHDVLTDEGRILVCTARGRLKKTHGELVVGDRVGCSVQDGGAVIESAEPRRNLLQRPLVANVDQAALVFALRTPDLNLLLVDRFMIAIISAGLPLFLCLNKADLARSSEARAVSDHYSDLGYHVILTSAVTRLGRNRLLASLYGRTTVFCGPSGVGKSALLNMIRPSLSLATGEVSTKLGRGRHTTRATRLMPIKRGGFVVDTPGFARVCLQGIGRRELAAYFPEFSTLDGACQFDDCLHMSEPDCAVKRAVEEERVPASRYEHYRVFMEELAGLEQNNEGKTGRGWDR